MRNKKYKYGTGDRKECIVRVRLNENMFSVIREIAIKKGLSISSVVRKALSLYIK